MQKAFILSLFLFSVQLTGKCDTMIFPPLQPFGSNNSAQNYTTNITNLADPFVNRQNLNYSDVSQIEFKLYGKTYSAQDISLRLSRIEKTLFSTTYTNSTNEQRIDNIISNFNQINRYPNISKNVLSRIETQLFNQNFSQNGAQIRIERLEQKLFGAVQNGDLDARYRALQIAAKNYNSNADNSYTISPYNMGSLNTTGYNNYGVRNGLRSLAGAFGNSFFNGGSMTGFTPPITQFYGNYNNPYNQYPNGYGIYKGYRSNYGYRDDFQNYNTGAGVTILD